MVRTLGDFSASLYIDLAVFDPPGSLCSVRKFSFSVTDWLSRACVNTKRAT